MTQEEFDKLINENKVCCIKFGAEWCGPCKAMVPIIEEIAEEYKGKALVIDIDVEESSEVTAQFRIRNVPTTIFFKDGKAVYKIIGSASKNVITEELDVLL